MAYCIDGIKAVAEEAADAIMGIYGGEYAVEKKSDQSPLTEADRAANDIITESLKRLYPDIPVLSEEGAQTGHDKRRSWGEFWLIDPLDGTKEFMGGSGDFTVNIALVRDGKPVLGVVNAPAKKKLYAGYEGVSHMQEEGSKPKRIKAGRCQKPVRVVASASHFNQATKSYIESNFEKTGYELVNAGSSLKICMIAQGLADVYPRLGPTMEWDTAAAHAVLKNAGGRIYSYETKKELTYNKRDLRNPWFVAQGDFTNV